MENKSEIVIYNTNDGKASIALMTKDGTVWMNQNQLAELFTTSVPNISMHISKILNDKELDANSVVKYYLSTASDGKDYEVAFYSLDMILAIGFRVRSLIKMKILFPENKEQMKISNFFTDIGNRIKISELEIEKIETWKKGLLQKMFV